MTVIENQKNKIRQERFERLVKLHTAESKYWVTMENLDQKITAELFESPSTTGVTTEMSEYWRYCCPSMQPNRTLLRLLEAEDGSDDDEDDDDLRDRDGKRHLSHESKQQFMEPLDYLHDNEELITTQKESIRNMLNAMIGEGADRAKYETLVNDFVEIAEDLNGPLGDLNPTKTRFSSDEIPKPKKITAEDLMELIDQSVCSLCLVSLPLSDSFCSVGSCRCTKSNT
jgi:type I site-specific restriction-modification system R (restriction) subunit